ncbi:MAG TPA: hypothetical protein VHZ24_10645 [Pirellulales bacterium]|jgi:hypothetical protein|nr:hypothetical protein [Pirellulales bacterium]
MRIDRHYSRAARIAPIPTAGHVAKSLSKRLTLSKRARGKRARGVQINEQLPFVPPEDWYEPREDGLGYRVIVCKPGEGYRHVLTPQEVRQRLAELPSDFVRPLEQVQFARMTRKKQSFPCYGMQWGSSLYLYPIEVDLVERYDQPPKPNQVNEARMYGGCWEQDGHGWKLVWTEEAIKDFYLNNILIHELGHLLDNRNSRTVDRERFAEWFAIRYGYQPTRPGMRPAATRRHARA